MGSDGDLLHILRPTQPRVAFASMSGGQLLGRTVLASEGLLLRSAQRNLGYMAKLKPEFDKRNTKIIGLSVDPVDNHKRWSNDIQETQGHAPNYPMIGDTDLKVSKAWQTARDPRRHVRRQNRGRQSDGAKRLRHRPR